MTGFCTRISRDSQKIGIFQAILCNAINEVNHLTLLTKGISAFALSVIAVSPSYALAKKCFPGAVQRLMPTSFLKKIPIIFTAGAGFTLFFVYLTYQAEKICQQLLIRKMGHAYEKIKEEWANMYIKTDIDETIQKTFTPLIEEFFIHPPLEDSKNILDFLYTLEYEQGLFKKLFKALLGDLSGNRLQFLENLGIRFKLDQTFAKKNEWSFSRACWLIINDHKDNSQMPEKARLICEEAGKAIFKAYLR